MSRDLNNIPYEIFISYRRTSGWELARLIFQTLSANRYKVFFDVERLFKGTFPDKLKAQLLQCKVFIPVLVRDTLDRCVRKPKDWVRVEIETAIEENKIIIPIMDDSFVMPKKLCKKLVDFFDPKLNKNIIFIDRNNFQVSMDKLCNKLVNYFAEILTKQTKQTRADSPSKLRSNIKQKLEDYSESELKDDVATLEQMYELFKTSDNRISKVINREIIPTIGSYHSISILDIDCGLGYIINDLLSVNDNITKYVATSIDTITNETIRQVIEKKYPHRLEMMDLSPLDNDFVEQILKKHPKGFDLVILNNVLTHYKDIEMILKKANEVISPNGYIVLSDRDACLNFSYPDETGLLEEYKQIQCNSNLYGNIYTGRQLYSQLVRAGFKNIKLSTVLHDSHQSTQNPDSDTFYDRKENFYIEFEKLIDYYKSNSKTEKDRRLSSQIIKWLKTNEANLLKSLTAKKTFTSNVAIVCVGQKNK